MRLGKQLTGIAIVSACILVAGCSVSTRGGDPNHPKDVEIKTPLGDLSVHKGNLDPKAAGLSEYPGAQPKKSSDMDGDANANVNISSSMFGMKLVVLKYQTNDSPEKVLGFYKKDLGKYGNVLDCTGGFNMTFHKRDKDSDVSCQGGSSKEGYTRELKVGTENNQRIVAVKPAGNGTEFVMVYVRARDEKETM
ncbi:MAG TPA: hypothetical protein VHN74_11825 [Candidatus Angelobacter sp.]|jgi:hypothetical protein|nr:hypothetical protein [Candidatus Angelobacter sp.]